jgi:cytochrome P450
MQRKATRPVRVSLAEFTNTFVPFALVLAAALVLPERTTHLTNNRAAYSLWAAIALAVPALGLYLVAGRSPALRHYWLLLWSFGLAAFLVHLGFALTSRGGAHPLEVVLAAWWLVDLVLAWRGRFEELPVVLQRTALHAALVIWFEFVTWTAPHGSTRAVAFGLDMPRLLAVAVLATIGLGTWAYLRRGPATVSAEGAGLPLPPGSFGLPLLGETPAMARDGHAFFRSRVRKYGPVFKTSLFGEPVVVFAGEEAFGFLAKQATVTREGANPRPMQELLDWDCLPLLDPPEHTRRKRLVLAATGPEALGRILPIIEATARSALERWSRQGEFSWVPEYKKMAVSLVSALFLGPEARGQAAAANGELGTVIDDFLKGFTSLPLNLPFTAYGKAVANRDRLLKLIDASIARHHGQTGGDLMDELLAARDEAGGGLDDATLAREVLHLLFASYGGIYISLTFLSLALAQYPEIRDRARAEVLRVAPEGPLDLQRLQGLVELDCLSREIRRYYPINASTFFARARETLQFGGYAVPRGWLVVGAIHMTLHDPAAWPEPERFDPGRFAPDRLTPREQAAYVPQGAGPPEGHRCPGEPFITHLMKVMGVLLLRDYEWDLPAQDLSLSSALFPIPRSGLRVTFRRRAAEGKP